MNNNYLNFRSLWICLKETDKLLSDFFKTK